MSIFLVWINAAWMCGSPYIPALELRPTEIHIMARITVEDCLEKESNRFSLVRLASKRAKQLLQGQTPVTDTRGNKAIVSALREIATGKVKFRGIEELAEGASVPAAQPEPAPAAAPAAVAAQPVTESAH